jgi:hypothetical protein
MTDDRSPIGAVMWNGRRFDSPRHAGLFAGATRRERTSIRQELRQHPPGHHVVRTLGNGHRADVYKLLP